MLKVEKLTRQSRFSELNFTLNNGEILFLLGPNGAGKTSLLEVLAGYSKYTGELTINDQNLNTLSISQLAQLRAWLPQQVELDPYISLKQAFELALYPLGLNLISPEVELVLSEIYLTLDLERLKERRLGELSGGELQRVQIALRLIQVWPSLNPDAVYLLLDEPTSGLDLCHQNALFSLLESLKEQGISIIISVHDLNLALKYSNNVLLLKEGKQYFFGPVEQGFQSEMIKTVFNVDSELLNYKDQRYLMLS